MLANLLSMACIRAMTISSWSCLAIMLLSCESLKPLRAAGVPTLSSKWVKITFCSAQLSQSSFDCA